MAITSILKAGLIGGCGILVVSVACAGLWAWAPDRARAKLLTKYAAEATRFVVVDGTVLRVQELGGKNLPAIIFLNGFGSSLETWDVWAQDLAKDFHVVSFDFAGSGLSGLDPASDYRDGRTVQLVQLLMDHLKVDRATLIGNSLGGRIAWKFAVKYPQRVARLVLISPDGFASPGFEYGKKPQVPLFFGLMKYFAPKSVFRANLLAAYADPHRLEDSTLDRYYDLFLAAGNREAMLLRLGQTVLEEPRPLLRQILAPTLLLWGTADRMIPFANAADYSREIPTCTLASLEGMGHVPQEEFPLQSLVPLRTFLAAN